VATTRTEDGHIEYQNKRYNINQRDEGTEDDRGRDGGTNFILGITEQETRIILHEHDDDDDDDDDDNLYSVIEHLIMYVDRLLNE